MRRHLKRPEGKYGKTQHDEIRDDVDHAAGNDHGDVVDALWNHTRRPFGVNWNTLEDRAEHLRH